MHPRHFIFILVCQQFEIIPGNCFGESGFFGVECFFQSTYFLNLFPVSVCICLVLIKNQPPASILNQVINALNRLRFLNSFRLRKSNTIDLLKIMLSTTPPEKSLEVLIHRNRVDTDRLLNGRGFQWNQSMLKGITQEKQVGGDGIPDQCCCQSLTVNEFDIVRACCFSNRLFQFQQRKDHVGIPGEITGNHFMAVDHHLRVTCID